MAYPEGKEFAVLRALTVYLGRLVLLELLDYLVSLANLDLPGHLDLLAPLAMPESFLPI